MGKNSPSAPDPYQSAAAQYQYGTKAAEYNKALNATNVTGPTGSTTNQISGYDPQTGAPIYTQSTQLTAPEQALLSGSQTGGLESEIAGINTLGQLPSSPFMTTPGAPSINTRLDTSNVSALPSGAALDALGRNAQATALAGEQAAADPAMAQEKEQLQAQLVNSGNGPGTPAYENAMAALDARQANTRTQEAGAAITAGTGLEQTRYGEAATSNAQQFQEDLQRMTAENQAQGMSEQDAISAAMAQLQQRSGIAGLGEGLVNSGGAQIPTSAGIPTSSTSTPDIMQAFQNAYQGQLNAYNANAGTTDAALGALGSIAAAAIFASDERLKTDIEEVGETEGGLPAYLFHYRGEDPDAPRHLGVMAQEVEELFPDAVLKNRHGVRFVDYARIA